MVQVPWSIPHSVSNPTEVFVIISAVSAANCGFPGAGYSTANSSSENPPKSWMVAGFSLAVMKVPLVSQ